jgi:hypothetical protein
MNYNCDEVIIMNPRLCEEANWTIYPDGTIISKKTNKPRKTFDNRNGYKMVTYTSPEGTKNYYVHRLVAKYFIGEIPLGMEVNHKDGNKQNNHYDNLEIITSSENIRHMDKLGLRKCATYEKNGSGKLTESQVINLIKDILLGMTNSDIGTKYNLHSRYISLIRHKRRHLDAWRIVEGATTMAEASTSKRMEAEGLF